MSHRTVENFGIIDQLVGGDDGHLYENSHDPKQNQSKLNLMQFHVWHQTFYHLFHGYLI